MAEISRSALFGKLNRLAYRGFESATVFCKLRGNPRVELVHWIHQILQLQDSDLHRIVRRFNLHPSHLARDVIDALDRLPRSPGTACDLSAHVEVAAERGWVLATLMFGQTQVRTGHLLLGVLRTRHLRQALVAVCAEFEKIEPDTLSETFAEVVSDSPEDIRAPGDSFRLGVAMPDDASGAMAPAQMDEQAALRRFTIDLTGQARAGKLDPVVGRDRDIRQMVDILMRRRQNNPMLIGEAGVGKTAVVEGLACRIAAGDVPPPLKEMELRTLDVGLLQAGASMKGEFEHRLRQVIEEVQSSARPVILFIDEAHTLVGAGGAAGTGDAANLLKPALARGNLRTIGATTWTEYKKYVEKDPALARRFQAVQIDEPGEEQAILMMRGVAGRMEQHHRVQILDEALEAAVKLSHRYIPARQLPDKAVSLLDTACARVAISQHAVPPEVDDTRKRIQALEAELSIIANECAVGVDVTRRAALASEKLELAQARLQVLETQWQAEQALVERVLALRSVLRGEGGPAEDVGRAAMLEELNALQAELADQQKNHAPLVLAAVDGSAVSAVVADWTGIPVGRVARNELETVMDLAGIMSQRVIGQDHAMEMIARRVQTARAGLDHPGKPVGVFMLAGASGIGKTETALALADAMYGGEQNLITINMSEFQEAHSVSTLKGAPPGYVGYGEGGVLTEAVRRKPHSVVLLDEVEKAHADVHEIFFQVFDKGVMEDGEGRPIDFRNTLILLTTNVGAELIDGLCRGRGTMPTPEDLAKALHRPLLEVFPPALLGRLVTVPYYPLSERILGDIVKLQLDRIKSRIEGNYGIPFECSGEVAMLVVKRCTESGSGGRMIDAVITHTLLPEISRELLRRTLDGKPAKGVAVSVDRHGFSYEFA